MNRSDTPSRVNRAQRRDSDPALNHTLLLQVLSNTNLRLAWKQVRSNGGAAGVDGITIERYSDWIRPQWLSIRQRLLHGTYRPSPVKRVRIPKDDGTQRELGIPTVLDRVIQQAIVQVLSPLFDPSFSEHSYGFRPQRSAHDALRHVQQCCQEGYRITVDIDLSKFFDRVNHDKLMTLLGRRTGDKALLRLIGRFLRAGIQDGNTLLPSREGVPQGGPLSPLLSNVMLDPLDRELTSRGHRFARYADDLIILVKSQRAGERVMRGVTRYVDRELKLKVNVDKSQVVKSSRCKFLGFSVYGKYLRWHPSSIAKLKHRVRELTNRTWGVSMDFRIKKLSIYLRGWINYYGIGNQYQQCVELDHWIRRRIRMCFWKQWRRPRTKIRNLINLGLPARAAIACGLSSKGWWHSAKSPGINAALGKQYLKSRGLFSLKEGWVSFHYG